MGQPRPASKVASVLAGPRRAVGEALQRAAWSWAGVPSGPLGWISTRTAFPLLSGTIYRAMADALQPQSDDELLDVGCGSGAFLAQHAGHVHRVAGIDLSDVQIDLAHRHLADRIAAGTAEIVKGDASALPWPDGSFTAATSISSFEAFPDPPGVLAEVFRVLRPGGRAVLAIGGRVPPETVTQQIYGGLWVWSEDDVRAMMEQAGFDDVSLHYVRSWGNDPLSRLFIAVWDLLGQDMSEVRLVSATKA